MVEILRDVRRIVEMRDGCVYRTVSVGEQWVGMDEQPPTGFLFASVSMTSDNIRPTIRTRK